MVPDVVWQWYGRSLPLLLGMVLPIGCSPPDPTPLVGESAIEAATPGSPIDPGYRLVPADRIRIVVPGQPALSGDFVLDARGGFLYPPIGQVEAGDLTVAQLERRLLDKLEPDYLSNAKVSVEVLPPPVFFVVGEVERPGSYAYIPNLSVLQAVATAGGETYRADMRAFYLRRKVNGKVVRVEANLDTVVRPGDTVIVRPRYF